jgi:hypothetical protein
MGHDDEHEEEQDESVGYGRPPKQTRFKKGQSGNPAGRPKGALNLATILARILQEPVVVTEHGQKITITKLEAVIKQLTHQAMSGELRASAQVVPLVQWMESQHEGPEPATELSESDQRVRDRILNRLARQAQKGGTSDGTDPDPR